MIFNFLVSKLREVGEAILDVVYPDLCARCNVHETVGKTPFCFSCFRKFPRFTESTGGAEEYFKSKFWGRLEVRNAIGLFHFQKQSSVQAMIHDFKYHGRKDIAYWCGQELGRIILQKEIQIDYLIPVPSHPKKVKKRGYNPSEVISRGISDITKIKILDLLQIDTYRISQTQNNRQSRFENAVKGLEINELSIHSLVKNDRLMIVDDIVTTGATLESCANIILKRGLYDISFATVGVGFS